MPWNPRQVSARQGNVIGTDTEMETDRPFFNLEAIDFWSKPRERTEVLLTPDTIVVFIEIPCEVRRHLDLRERGEHVARVVNEKGELGFIFAEGNWRTYFPFQEGRCPQIQFKIVSVPKEIKIA